jgi:DNA transposition AAA+ family ATPase
MFIETQEYRRFKEFCDACRRDRYIGLCYGTAGVGKTLSARYYTDPNKLLPPLYWPSEANFEKGLENHVVLYTPSVVNSPGKVASDLTRCRHCVSMTLLNHFRSEEKWKLRELEESMEVKWFEAYRTGGVDADTDEAAEYSRERDAYYAEWRQYHSRRQEIQDVPVLVVIDEADRLKMASLEQVREIFDEGGMGLVLIGMPGLEKRLARYAQLYSRVGFVHEFRSLAEKEVRGLLSQGWKPPGVVLPSDWVSDEEAVTAILRITDGNFRLLERLLTQIARVLEINNLPKVTLAVVEVARESLVIGTA